MNVTSKFVFSGNFKLESGLFISKYHIWSLTSIINI